MDGADRQLVVLNAKLVTMASDGRIAEAVFCRNGRIAAVGSNRDAMHPHDPATATIIDAKGKAVVPGLVDGHAHLDREGLKNVFPSLEGCRSVRDVLDRIAELVDEAGPGAWVVTMPVGDPPYYWNVPGCLAENRFPTRRELDEVAPENPVYIRPIWGYWRHTLPLVSVANSRALELAGVDRNTDPGTPSVTFEKDAEGELTGRIRESTFMPVAELRYFHMAPRFTHSDRVAGIENAMRIYNATGTTSVLEEHGAAQELIGAWRAIRESSRSTVRATLVFSPSWGAATDIDYAEVFGKWAGWLGGRGLGDEWLRVSGMFTDTGIKIDAALRSAAAPYTGWSGFNYDHGVPEERMVEFMCEAARSDIRIAVIGPHFLPLLEKVDRIVPIGGKRWIVGHLDILDDRLIGLARDLGVVMTTHTNSYIYKQGTILKDRAGAGREDDVVPLRRLIDAGVTVGLASDNVPTSLFHPVWHTVARKCMLSEDPVAPGQALTRQEALHCATMGGARLTFEEDDKGSIEPGKFADLVVLDRDPLSCPEDALKDIAAEITIVGGEIVYEREAA